MKKRGWITFCVILGVIILSAVILTRQNEKVSEETAKCIGQKSKLYVQLGCSACVKQEKIFGDSYQYLNRTDCWFEREKCLEAEISATPTWIINGKSYIGVQTIEKLKELAEC